MHFLLTWYCLIPLLKQAYLHYLFHASSPYFLMRNRLITSVQIWRELPVLFMQIRITIALLYEF
jgi:hypothetical protein